MFEPTISARGILVNKLQPMLLNNRTYGRYNSNRGTFWCTHGGWEAKIELIDEEYCTLFGKVVVYKFIEEIPEDYDRV
jgi:hypothetical protein